VSTVDVLDVFHPAQYKIVLQAIVVVTMFVDVHVVARDQIHGQGKNKTMVYLYEQN
jgi:hypothetical protein